MKYKDVVKDYKYVTDAINKCSDEHIHTICEKMNMDSFPINIQSLSDSDLIVGTRIYAGEHHEDESGLRWHIYRITHIRSGAVFFKRDNEKMERFFALHCIARNWMFPMKAIVYSTSKVKIEPKCECPLVKIIVREL